MLSTVNPELMSGDALNLMANQTFENLRNSSPAFDDLLKASSKYQQLFEAATAAAAVFVEQLGKVAATATRARGDTNNLGQKFQKLARKHQEHVARNADQANKLYSQFVVPLQKRLKADAKALAQMEDDFKNITKDFKTDLRKASNHTLKAKKAVNKKGNVQQPALTQAQDNFVKKTQDYETFNQRILKTVMIEERRRYCYLVDNYVSVFGVDFRGADNQRDVSEALCLTVNPEILPQTSFKLIQDQCSLPPMQQTQPERDRDKQARLQLDRELERDRDRHKTGNGTEGSSISLTGAIALPGMRDG